MVINVVIDVVMDMGIVVDLDMVMEVDMEEEDKDKSKDNDVSLLGWSEFRFFLEIAKGWSSFRSTSQH